MKKKILGGIAVLAIAATVAFNMSLDSQKSDYLLDLALGNVEALAQDEYIVGFPGTNWKEYTIQCTVTTGFDYILVYTHTYTYTTIACGYGTGWCLSPAGC